MASSSTDPQLEARRMMMCFRVNELKEFLKEMNVSTSGKKGHLQDRALKFVESGNPKVFQSIKDIYQRSFPRVQPFKSPPKPPISHSTGTPPSFHVKHPDVRLKPHPFFQHIDSVVRTTTLVSPAYLKKSTTIQFHLTPYHIRRIFDSESTPGNYQTQVILRFCKQETSCEQEDFYPGNCYVTINGQNCPIPGYIPNYSLRPEYKRNGKPINITSYIHTSPAVVNTLAITWSHDIIHPQGFCFSVDLMSSLSPSDLLQKLKSKGIRSPEVSRAMLKEKLLGDRDSEISTTSLKISLTCPLGKTRMIHPCKAASCNHVQCFDASIYLQMNERKPKWMCPVCDRPAPFTDLLIDGLLLEICEKSSEDMIEFSKDGSWHPIKKNSGTLNSIIPLTPPTSIMISDSPQIQSRPAQSSQPLVIDLTEDSDREDTDDEESVNVTRHSPIRSTTDSVICRAGQSFPSSKTLNHIHSYEKSPSPSSTNSSTAHTEADGNRRTQLADVLRPPWVPLPLASSSSGIHQENFVRVPVISDKYQNPAVDNTSTTSNQQMLVQLPFSKLRQPSSTTNILPTSSLLRTHKVTGHHANALKAAVNRLINSNAMPSILPLGHTQMNRIGSMFGNDCNSESDSDSDSDSSSGSSTESGGIHLVNRHERNRRNRYLPYDYTIASPVSSSSRSSSDNTY